MFCSTYLVFLSPWISFPKLKLVSCNFISNFLSILFIIFRKTTPSCRSLSKPWQGKPSPLRLSPVTLLKMSRLRFRTRKESLLTNRGWSLRENSWRTEEPCQTTISRKVCFFSYYLNKLGTDGTVLQHCVLCTKGLRLKLTF